MLKFFCVHLYRKPWNKWNPTKTSFPLQVTFCFSLTSFCITKPWFWRPCVETTQQETAAIFNLQMWQSSGKWKKRKGQKLYLKCRLNNIHIRIYFAEIVLAKFCADMLHNQIYGNMVITSTRYDHISILLWWQNKIIKSRFDELSILKIWQAHR